MTNTNDTREPVDVIKDFTEGWLRNAESIVQQLTELTARAESIVQQRTEDLCRWGDDGGYTP